MIKCLLFGHKYQIIDKFSTNVDYARYIFWCPACGSLKQKNGTSISRSTPGEKRMIAVLEEDWGVSDEGNKHPEPLPRERSWYDSFKNFIGDILFGK